MTRKGAEGVTQSGNKCKPSYSKTKRKRIYILQSDLDIHTNIALFLTGQNNLIKKNS